MSVIYTGGRVRLDAIIASRWYIIYCKLQAHVQLQVHGLLHCLILMASVIVHSQVCHVYWEDSNRSHQVQAMKDINEAGIGACYTPYQLEPTFASKLTVPHVRP